MMVNVSNVSYLRAGLLYRTDIVRGRVDVRLREGRSCHCDLFNQ